MPSVCILCSRKSASKENIYLHGFPRNRELCKAWKTACGIPETANVSNSYICTFHFALDQLKLPGLDSKSRVFLQHGAVPSINIPKHIHYSGLIPDCAPLDVTPVIRVDENRIQEVGPEEIAINVDPILNDEVKQFFVTVKPPHILYQVENINNAEIPRVSECLVPNSPASVKTTSMRTSADIIAESWMSTDNNPSVAPQADETTNNFVQKTDQSRNIGYNEIKFGPLLKRPRFDEPVFISQITPHDFSTGKKVHQTMNFIKERFMEKSNTIKLLQNINSRQRERIVSLEARIKKLEGKMGGEYVYGYPSDEVT
ncbi:hypothetical protein NQ317_019350 [Molorchus minor]|uniref:THAP-type domain-containing protein n=1 Tax=Molorchus minor TaxID=1323400 RepID=A0ABQ9J8W0_9CUCU|nr:hypothetical protein NQ317_019350 [Molorchus minor]